MNWKLNPFQRRELYDDLSEEIRLHIDERAEQLVAEGMKPRAGASKTLWRAFQTATWR